MDMSAPAETFSTAEFLARCAEAGFPITEVQLASWRAAGLLPRPQKRGRGYKLGTEPRWAVECLPRAVLIVRALSEGDPSYRWAARVLIGAGYAPAKLALLRALVGEALGTLGTILAAFRAGSLPLPDPRLAIAPLLITELRSDALISIRFIPLKRSRASTRD